MRDLRHLSAELRAAAEGLDDVARGLAQDTALDYPPHSMTARAWRVFVQGRLEGDR